VSAFKLHTVYTCQDLEHLSYI